MFWPDVVKHSGQPAARPLSAGVDSLVSSPEEKVIMSNQSIKQNNNPASWQK